MKNLFNTFIIISIIFLGNILLVNNVFASCKTSTAGIPHWYRGLVDNNCETLDVNSGDITLKEFITVLIINIGDMVVRTIGYASVLFLIFGGFKYVLSAGSDNKIVAAKKTIQNSIVGLIISLLSVFIVNIIFNLLGGKVNSSEFGLNNQLSEDFLGGFVLNLMGWLSGAAIVMIMFGGAQYVLAAGDSTKITTAKKTITYSIIGLVVAGLSYTIIGIITGVFG